MTAYIYPLARPVDGWWWTWEHDVIHDGHGGAVLFSILHLVPAKTPSED